MLSVQYLLESAFCLASLYALYWLFLRRETFFQWNRAYLLLAPVLALTAPALHIRLERAAAPRVEKSAAAATPATPPMALPTLIEQAQAAPLALYRALERPLWSLTLGELLWWVYVIVAAVFLFRLTVQAARLWSFIRRCRRSARDGIVWARGPSGTPLASFFGFVFWHPGNAADEEKRFLYAHELVHARQWHSLDLILFELLLAFQWFNPLLYAYRRSLRAVHEYIADASVVRQTGERYAYARVLARHQSATPSKAPVLVNTFHSLIKNRLIMLARQPSAPVRRFKYLLALPLFAALLLLFSFRLIESLPSAAPIRSALQQADLYVARLGEVTVAAPKPLQAEPSPYIFYWGAFQTTFMYLEVNDTYLAEAHISPEELKEAIQREPRLWNGQTLEQHLGLEINGFPIRSDYYRPETYQVSRAELGRLVDQALTAGYIKIDRVSLPGGKYGEIHVFLNGARPGWIRAASGPEKPLYEWLKWGGEQLQPEEERFVTEEQFWAIALSPAVIKPFGETTLRTPEKWNFSLSDGSTRIVRPLADHQDAYTLPRLQERLLREKDRIRPGALLWFYAWDAASLTNRVQAVDTLYLLDPESKQYFTQIVSRYQNGNMTPGGTALVGFRVVSPDDPRLFLRDSDAQNFTFEWGAYTNSMLHRHGRSYTRGDGSEQIHADPAYEAFSLQHTRAEILDIVRRTARLYREGALLENLEFSLGYKDHWVRVRNGQAPDDMLQILERELRPGDQLRLAGFRAMHPTTGHLVATPAWFAANGRYIPEKMVKQLDVQHFGPDKLLRFHLPLAEIRTLQQRFSGQAGVYFQQGDIDLGNVIFVLEVRSDDPKPPLRPAAPSDTPVGVELRVSPNPAHDRATLEIQLVKGGAGTLSVVDAGGMVHFSQQMEFHAGVTPFALPLHQIKAKGILYVRLEMTGGVQGMARMVVE